MNRIRSLGRGFLAVFLFTAVAAVLIPVAAVAEIEWLGGLALGLAVLGLATLLAVVVLRLSQQVISVRRAVKQANDRQLALSGQLQCQISDRPMGNIGVGLKDDWVNVGYGVEYEYAERVVERRTALNTYALTTRSLVIRDSLARAATGGHWREENLTQFFRLEAGGYLAATDAARHHLLFDVRNLVRFAGVLVNQQKRHTDLSDADLIYHYVEKHWGFRVMPRYDRMLAVEAAMELNGYNHVGTLMTRFGVSGETIQNRLFTANGIVRNDPSEHALVQWASRVSQVYEAEGLAPVTLLPPTHENAHTHFDRLDSDADYAVTDGPKVTILLPTFNADRKIDTAIRSLLKQTWQNFEILMIDDGSPDEALDLLREVAAVDNRISLLSLGRNRGAYVARNFGLEHATGDFITVHDDDDWSHPQKIEYQVKNLLGDTSLTANWTNHVRTTEDLLFIRLNNNPVVTQFNFSSIMFRKDLVDTLGGWNNVNRSGDSEYKDRIEAYSDKRLEAPVAAPMSFTRTGGTSLTQGEMSRGYIDGARRFYMLAYQAKHRLAKETGSWTPDIMELPAGVPENLKDSNRNTPMGHFDVIYATDFRFPGGNSSLAQAELESLISAGRTVGLIQLDSPVNSLATPLSTPILNLLERHNDRTVVLSLLDRASADLLIVRNPSVAQFVDELATNIAPENVVLIVNSTPVLSDGTGQVYSIRQVKRNLENLFSVDVKVFAESQVTRELSTLLGDGELFEDDVWPGMVNTDRFAFVERTPDPSRKPIVGRHSRDSILKWPENLETFRQIYVQPESYETRVLGGLEETKRMLEQSDLDAIRVHEFGTMDPVDFLADLDFWVYFSSDRLKESFGMGAAEAIATGLVVILPPSMKSTFGSGAIYCEPTEVAETIETYWNSPDLYREQAERARQACMDNYSALATLARMGRYARTPETQDSQLVSQD